MISIIKTLFSLRKTAFFAIILVLLAILFSQLAFSKDLDISGKMFLDMNSNGKFDASDLPLPGYTIYIDANDNSIFDPGEANYTTSANGSYSFTKVPLVGSVSEWVLPGYSFQPSSPSPGFSYNLSNLNEALKDRLDFGNIPRSAQNDKNSSTSDLSWYSIYVAALLILLGGVYVLHKGISKLEGITNGNLKENNAILLIVFGSILLLFGLYLWMVLLQQSGNKISVVALGSGSSFSIALPIILVLLVFGAVLLMLYGHYRWRASEPGEMRKTIAGLLVLGLVAIVFVALTGRSLTENKDIITQYIELVGIVVAFYFGSKAASDAYKQPEEAGNAQTDLDIETVTYDKNTGKIEIKVINRDGLNFEVDGVAITDENKIIDMNLDVEKKPSDGNNRFTLRPKNLSEDQKKKLEGEMDSDPEKKYKIIIKTTSIGSKTKSCKIEKPEGSIVCPAETTEANKVSEAISSMENAKKELGVAKDKITEAKDKNKTATALVDATTAIKNANKELTNAAEKIEGIGANLDQATAGGIKTSKDAIEMAIGAMETAKTGLGPSANALDTTIAEMKTAKDRLGTAISNKMPTIK
jgi:hypothetical protein